LLKASVLTAAVETWPLPAGDILEGNPEFQFVRLWESADTRFTHGIVRFTPGSFRWNFKNGETMVFVEGRGTIRLDSGGELSFGPGDMVFVPRGGTTWVILETVCQTYHIDRQEPLEG
jgi:uncharacterized cupin superfamily protein